MAIIPSATFTICTKLTEKQIKQKLAKHFVSVNFKTDNKFTLTKIVERGFTRGLPGVLAPTVSGVMESSKEGTLITITMKIHTAISYILIAFFLVFLPDGIDNLAAMIKNREFQWMGVAPFIPFVLAYIYGIGRFRYQVHDVKSYINKRLNPKDQVTSE